MKVIDSGMPAEHYWNSLFNRQAVLEWLALNEIRGPITEIGCGYGSFTLPLLQRQAHAVHAFDIEEALIQQLQVKAARLQPRLATLHAQQRDVVQHGTGLPNASMALVLLFNLLHSEHNVCLLKEALRILAPQGRVAILHWRKDIPTPRGPALDSRPDIQRLRDELIQLETYTSHGNTKLHRRTLKLSQHQTSLGPYHWGVQVTQDWRSL